MFSPVLSLCIIILSILSTSHHVHAQNPQSVQTSFGIVTGKVETVKVGTLDVTYYSYKGIPYANVTTRFKAPTPMTTWKYVVAGDKDGPICPQIPLTGSPEQNAIQDENCLFLNIYTPQLPSPTNNLPVLVFIHGGSFIFGSGSSSVYGPRFFMAEGGVILVTFNYRLGIFGLLSTGTRDAQGNAGMKDQVEALKWIKQEISKFGGDPTRVTIFGENAGGRSVVHHLMSPMSKGLFHRAIAESGTALADWGNIEASVALKRATKIANNVSCSTENVTRMIECLSKMSVSALVQAQTNNILTEQEMMRTGLVFSPVIETKFDEEVFLADYSVNVLNNLTTTVPLIIGTNKDEGMIFLRDDDNTYAAVDRNLQYFVPRVVRNRVSVDTLNQLVDELRKFYFKGGKVSKTTLPGYVNLYTDHLFMYPTAETVQKLVQKNTGDVYLYHFVYSGGYKLTDPVAAKLSYQGVSHAEELRYLFWTNQDLSNTASDDYKTSQKMVKMWKTFATNGQPINTTDEVINTIQWPKITNASQLTYLEMDVSFSQKPDYYKERVALWDKIVKSSSIKIQPTIVLTLVSLFLIFKMF